MSVKINRTNQEGKRLRRPFDERTLGGVAAGLAAFFGLDVAHVRIAFVVLTIVGGAGIPLYLAAWALIPEEGSDIAIADGIFSSYRIEKGTS
jgi:phage shock protein C